MTNRVTEILKCEYPIISASMAFISTPELTATVSNAGGFGVLNTVRPLAFVKEGDKPIEAIRSEIQAVQALTEKSFAIQLLAPDNLPSDDAMMDETIQVYKEEGIQYVFMISTTDNPKSNELKIVTRLKEEGFTVLWRDVNPTVQGAIDAEEAGADIIIATGRDEGGSLPADTTGTMTITFLIVDAVDVPVVAAGGITKDKHVNAVLELGAEGAYVGSLFLLADEAGTHQKAKDAITEAETADLLEFPTWPTYYRCVPTKLAEKCYQMYQNGADRMEINDFSGGFKAILTAMVEGNLDEGFIVVSKPISQINEQKSAEKILKELVTGFE